MTITKQAFAVGLTRLGVALRGNFTESTLAVYFEAMADELDPAKWEGFTKWAVRDGCFDPFFPTLDELRRAYGRWVFEASALPEARLSKAERLAEREERRVEAREGFEVFKRELRRLGIDVKELEQRFSWPRGEAKPVQRKPRAAA